MTTGGTGVFGLTAGKLLFCAIAMCLGLQAWLALVTEFNWDEFFFLSHIYSHQRGDLTGALQMFQVHLLGWLTSVPGDEIGQLEAGRLFMLLCEVASCAFIYRLARAFFEPIPSLLAVLAFASAGFTVIHGASFRADPLATALLMLSLATLARGPAGAVSAILIAASAAVAALITVKVIFYAPAFAGVAAWRLSRAQDRRRILVWLGTTGFAAAILFALLYALHLLSLPGGSNAAASAALGRAGRTTILEAGLLPRSREIVRAAMLAPAQTVLMLFAVAGLTLRQLQGPRGERMRAVAILGCAAPLLSLLFYRNAFPYFFPFILPPAMLLVAWAVQEAGRARARLIIFALMLAFLIPAAIVAMSWSRRDQSAQQELIAAVHRAFPEPVPYIDRNSMISSFPKRGFFMSSWGMLEYRRQAPILPTILGTEPIPLLVLNSPALAHAVGVRDSLPAQFALHRIDRKLLRENFIPHWGPVWVAGKRLRVGNDETLMPVLIPGSYTLEGRTIVLNGRRLLRGDTVELRRGVYRIRAEEPGIATLRWGNHLHRPAASASSELLYQGF